MKKQEAYQKRKKFENDYTKYKELDTRSIRVEIIRGTIMHKCNIVFSDGNKFSLTIHKTGDNLQLAQPKMWEYTIEKLAVLDYLTQLEFTNDSYTIIEQKDLFKESKELFPYKIAGQLTTPSHVIYALSTETFHEKHFIDYDVGIESRKAKNFKFPVRYIR